MFVRHPVLKIPKSIMKETVQMTILGVVTSLGFDALAFLLLIGKEQIAVGNILLGLVLIGIYYVKNALSSFLELWISDVRSLYKEHCDTTITQTVIKLF